MLPGLVLPGGISINSYGKLEKGDCVSVNLTTNQASIAVGTAAHSSHDMYMCGGRGKCVIILHFLGDLLWSQGAKYNVPELGPPPGLDTSLSKELSSDSDSDNQSSNEDDSPESEDNDTEKEGNEPSDGEEIVPYAVTVN